MASPSSPPFLHLLLLFFSLLHHHHTLAATPPPPPTFPQAALPTKSGYLTINSTSGSAMFYTFYEAKTKNSTSSQAPILIWLQGGPGCSSMLGNLREVGPWIINQDLSLQPNPGSWNNIFSLLFIDNPIGTGFSIAGSPHEIPRNQYDVARHLFIAITKFVALDKSFKTRRIYLTGESYAGKYLPALGQYIIQRNAKLPAQSRVNLAGVAIGNGLTDPVIMVATHAETAFNLGLINSKQRTLLEKLENDAIRLAKTGRWSEATDARNAVLNTLTNMSGLATLYDFRRLTPYPNAVVTKFLNNAAVMKALNAKENITFALCSSVVSDALKEDVMKSTRSMVEFLVRNNMKLLLYQGSCDLRDGPMATEEWVKRMRWEEIGKYLDAERKVWRVGGLLAGYVQRWKGFSNVVVMNAGHLVPTDQPVNAKLMMEDWVLDKGLFA